MVRCTSPEQRRREELMGELRKLDPIPPMSPVLEDILTGACVLVMSVVAVLLCWIWVPCWVVGKLWNRFHKERRDG